jgi:DNA polymerase-1
MTTLILDIESDGLIPLIKNIWLVCTKVVETGDKRSFRSREDFQQYVSNLNPTLVVGHNIAGFDLEALRRVWGIEYKWDTKGCSFNGKPVQFLDTLQLSQFLNADRVPGHGLDSWGEKLGLEKIDFKDWSGYSEKMLRYCTRDVDLTERVYMHLLKELEDYE